MEAVLRSPVHVLRVTSRRWAYGAVILVGLLTAAGLLVTPHEDAGARALRLAALQLGPDYRYDIRSLTLGATSLTVSVPSGAAITAPRSVTVAVRARKDEDTQLLTFTWTQ